MKTRGRNYELFGDSHMDSANITDAWMDEDVLILLGSKIDFKFQYTFDPKFQDKQVYARQNLLKGRKPWPHKDSVFLEGDTIYVYMR